MKKLKISLLLALMLLIEIPSLAADCFDKAAAYQGVNVEILRAIAIQENRRCDATVSKNSNGSVDIGCMQINSIHLPELARLDVFPSDLMDQCKNVFIGAWHYKKKIKKHGNNWIAVGAYHSETPQLRDKYAQDIISILRKHGFK